MKAKNDVIADLFEEAQTKQIFKNLRNYLAGRVIGVTRDVALMREVLKCLFCRAEVQRTGISLEFHKEDMLGLAKCYRALFSDVKKRIPGLFETDEELLLDPQSLQIVDLEIKKINFLDPKHDPVGDLYETFVASEMRGREGQFFTPLNAVSWLIEAINPMPGEKIIDPACGAGGFLSYIARKFQAIGVSGNEIANNIYGLEKDKYLADLAKAHIALSTLDDPEIHCADSLAWKTNDNGYLPSDYHEGFDVVVTNPPFGAKIQTDPDAVDGRFKLAYKWKLDKVSGEWIQEPVMKKNTPPQILFLERCLRLLKPGGRLGIVIPESVVSSPSHAYAVNYLMEHAFINAVIGMPENLFKTSGKGGTHAKTCLLIATKKGKEESRKPSLFMAEAKWCGNDSRGNPIPNDDLPVILDKYKEGGDLGKDSLGYIVNYSDLVGTVLAPRYYNPEPSLELETLRDTHDLIKISDLVKEGVLEFTTGDEVGKLSYGGGSIPFVRTSDISNWEIKLDFKHGVSEEAYQALKVKQDVREGDILMVRDGTYLIGSCAYVSKYDVKMVYQSHIYKIRVKKPDVLSPYLLLALLSSDPLQRQIKSKRFTQDIIDSIGKRVMELVLPVPKNEKHKAEIISLVDKSIYDRVEARELARKAKLEVVMAP